MCSQGQEVACSRAQASGPASYFRRAHPQVAPVSPGRVRDGGRAPWMFLLDAVTAVVPLHLEALSQDDGGPDPLHCASLEGRWHSNPEGQHGQLPREGSQWQLRGQSLLGVPTPQRLCEWGTSVCSGGSRRWVLRSPGVCPLGSFEGCGLGAFFFHRSHGDIQRLIYPLASPLCSFSLAESRSP